MTCEEFSNSFDTLLNSYSIQAGFGETVNKQADIALDEYEKSYYLTQAQNELVVALYNGNISGDSFESTEELRRYLANLVKEKSLSPISNTSGYILGMSSNSKFFTLPDDCWYITYENVSISDAKCEAYNPMDVYPVTQDDYNRTKRNPFRGANNRRALRLDLADGVIEIVCKYTVSSYYVRYLRKPNPIVLKKLPDDLTIEGVNTKTECELHEALHQKILETAVAKALQSKTMLASINNRDNK